MRLTALAGLPVGLCVLLLPNGASAAAARPDGAAGTTVRIVVSAGGDSEEVLLKAPAGQRRWSLAAPLRIAKAGKALATLETVELQVIAGGAVGGSFVVKAGANDATVTLAFTTPVSPALVDPWAYASCATTVTDTNGNGASLTGSYGGKMYQARYNTPAVTWQELLPSQTAAPNNSFAGRDRAPASGWQQIAASVESLEARWGFTLTAGDAASGTTKFAVLETPPSPGQALSLRVSSGGETAEIADLVPAEALATPRPGWTLPAPVAIRQSGRLLATVDSLEIEPGVDPNVVLSFAVGAPGVDTVFTFTSATVVVGANDPWAHASVALTLTDRDHTGGTLTGGQSGGHAFEARYNAGATVWAGLLGTHSVELNDTAVATDRWPAAGWVQIPGLVNDIQAQWRFTLSANDLASGTANFGVALAGPAATITATAGTPQQTQVSTAFPQMLEATVVDALGIPIVGTTVTFTAPASGASGTFPAGNTATTDSAGRASVPFAANSNAGAYVVTANVTPPLEPAASFQLENFGSVPALEGAGIAILALVVLLLGLLALRRMA